MISTAGSLFSFQLTFTDELLLYFSFSNIAYAALMASVSLMFGSLAHFYEKPVVVIATACAGSMAVLYGKYGKTESKLFCFHPQVHYNLFQSLIFPTKCNFCYFFRSRLFSTDKFFRYNRELFVANQGRSLGWPEIRALKLDLQG